VHSNAAKIFANVSLIFAAAAFVVNDADEFYLSAQLPYLSN
jgi:hypothetical protein